MARRLPRLTCADDSLDADAGRLDLFGEVPHGLVGILIGVGVDVGPAPRELHCMTNKKAHQWKILL